MTTYSKETALYDTGAIKNGIDEAATTASKYITYVDQENGIRVCDGNASNVDVNYTQINSEGMSVHKDNEEVASFGLETRIGSTESAGFTLSTDGMTGTNANGDVFFNVDYDGGETSTDAYANDSISKTDLQSYNGLPPEEKKYRIDIWSWMTPSTASSIRLLGSKCTIRLKSSYDYSGVSNSGYTLDNHNSQIRTYKWASDINLTAGTAYTETKTLLVTYINSRKIGVRQVINYTGTILQVTTYACFYNTNASKQVTIHNRVDYVSTVKAPAFIMGTNNGDAQGAFSCSIGKGLKSTGGNQLVIGRYNAEKTNAALIIGNGDAAYSPSNALTVDWYGNLITKGMAGVIQMFAGSTPPTGWLICDGSEYLISSYPELATVLGYTWGTPSSSEYFKLPDFRGRVPIGYGDGTATSHTQHNLGTYGGNEDSVVPYHNHSVNSVSIGSSGGHSHTITNKYTNNQLASGSNSPRFRTDGSTSTTNFSSIASNTGTHTHSVPSHNTNYAGTSGNTVGANMMPYATISFIICTGKTY